MKELLENYTLLFAMTVLTAAAILLKCICAIFYQVLLRDAEQIATTKNRQIRAMTTKFEACYKLGLPIYHPEHFVTGYLEQFRLAGINLRNLENTDIFCGVILGEATLLTIIGGIYYELPSSWVTIHCLTLVLFLLLLCTSEFLFQVHRRRKQLHLMLVNYFENSLQARMENQYLHPEERRAYEQEYFVPEEDAAEQSEKSSDLPSGNTLPEYISRQRTAAAGESVISEDMQELIDSLLQEDKLSREISRRQEQLKTAATSEKAKLVDEVIREYL